MSFRIALSGLNSATTDLNVISNNIANSNTTGFKYSEAAFADVFASGALDFRSDQVGNGVRLAAIAQQFAAPPQQPLPVREPTPITAGPAAHRAMFAPLPEPQPSLSKSALDMLAGLQMNVVVELGRTELTVSEVLGLGPGSVVELDRLAGEPVDILVNDRLIARGEVVVVDENFGVRVVEVVRRGAEAEERAG